MQNLKKFVSPVQSDKRKTWVGLYTRKTPTKKEKIEKQNRKDKLKGWE